MENIALIHSSQTLPFIEFLENNGCPTEHLLKKSKLPLALLDRVDGYIPEQQLWKLLDIVADREGLNNFGLRVGKDIHIRGLLGGLVTRLAQQPTLHSVLDTFCRLVKEESSDAQFWLSRSSDGKHHWFCRGGVPGIQVGQREAEQYTLLLMVELIRLVTCSQWQPKHVHLQSNDVTAFKDCDLLAHCDVRFGQNVTAIEIPSYIANTLDNTHWHSRQLSGETQMNSRKENHPAKDFTGSLSQVIEMYLNEESTDINATAELVGVSARTLQRRLAKESLGYSQLVDKARFKNSISLLQDKNNKLIDIAYDLGYSDPSHFSRAFKRWAGISPREFRRQHAL
jgi:AraC-like DNA-binding protein